MALYKQTFAAFAVATLCCALIASAAPANGKTNSKTSASNNSPFAAIRQQQQQIAAASKTSTKSAQAPFSQQQQQQQQEPENDADGSQQQQQVQVQQQPQQVQQQQEVDPSAAAQDSQPALIAPAAIAAPSGAEPEEANPRPEPYAFSYSWASGDATSAGASSRNEQQDAAGTVTGFYTLQGEDGRDRRVDYIADAAGFRATVRTNELGTEAKDPADVRMLASAPTDGQLRAAAAATELARQRAVLIPQPILAQPQPIFVIGAQSNQGPLDAASSANSQQQQQASLPLASGNQATLALPPNANQASKGARKNPPRERFASGTKQTPVLAESQQSQISQQLQEPFEQIRQSELKARSVRQAPFYLISV